MPMKARPGSSPRVGPEGSRARWFDTQSPLPDVKGCEKEERSEHIGSQTPRMLQADQNPRTPMERKDLNMDMKKHLWPLLSLILVAGMLLASCAPQATPAPETGP